MAMAMAIAIAILLALCVGFSTLICWFGSLISNLRNNSDMQIESVCVTYADPKYAPDTDKKDDFSLQNTEQPVKYMSEQSRTYGQCCTTSLHNGKDTKSNTNKCNAEESNANKVTPELLALLQELEETSQSENGHQQELERKDEAATEQNVKSIYNERDERKQTKERRHSLKKPIWYDAEALETKENTSSVVKVQPMEDVDMNIAPERKRKRQISKAELPNFRRQRRAFSKTLPSPEVALLVHKHAKSINSIARKRKNNVEVGTIAWSSPHTTDKRFKTNAVILEETATVKLNSAELDVKARAVDIN